MAPSLRTSGSIALISRAMALETSPRVAGPGAADRERDRRLGRPARRGVGRGPGRPGHPPPGVSTVFMTLRDAVADISVTVTCSRTLFDGLNPPLVEGASIVVHAKPSYYANRGTLSLYAREIRMVGLGELLARLERRRQLLAAEGLFAAELKRQLPFLPGTVGLVTAPNSAAERDVLENARRRWPAVALRGGVRRDAGPALGGRGDRGARAAGPQPGRRRDRRRPRRRLGRGPAAVLRRGAGPRGAPGAHAGRLRDRPRARLAAARPGRRRPRLHPDRRRQAGRPRRRRGGRSVAAAPATGSAATLAGWLAREQAGLDALRSRPALADPAACSTPAATRSAQLRDRARRCLGHALDRAADDIGHQRARARALSPLATLQRGYAVLQDADGHVVTSVAGVAAEAGGQRAGRRRPDPRDHHRRPSELDRADRGDR